MSLLVFGVDPGLHGAIATFIDSQPRHIFDMPTRELASGRTEIDVGTMAVILRRQIADNLGQPAVAVIELVNAQPKRDEASRCPVCHQVPMAGIGVAGAFHYGENAAAARNVFEVLGVPVHRVLPRVWKKLFGLSGGGPKAKKASRALALTTFPVMAPSLARQKDEGRAEALLIGRWGVLYHSAPGTPPPRDTAIAPRPEQLL